MVTGAPFVLTPLKETVPSVRTKVGGPKGWEVVVQPVMSTCRWSAPVSTPRLELKWLQPVKVASPWLPVSNSTQPQNPPTPKGGWRQRVLSLQLKESPICHKAVLP